jgi:protoporphyrin/coproporphyrin ferrochelatase
VPDSVFPRVAIVLFNLGGPDRPEAIRPFLLNLFRDPAILRVPFFIRPLLAWWIARARVAPATANYALLGGRSPLLDETRQQAAALEQAVEQAHPALTVKCFIAMRYWHPFSDAAVREVQAWRPDHVLLLPLYPQYSTTTTGSSLTAWRAAAANAGLAAPTTVLCCYFADAGYASSIASRLGNAYAAAQASLPADTKLRVLFSAHGLPETIVRRGDPYQFQIERTAEAVMRAWGADSVDWVVCYQSRATPQKWLDPSTEAEIERAAHDRVAVVVVPIAFVSEHSETLVELDVEYRALAVRMGVPGYFRLPTPNAEPDFVASMARLAQAALANGVGSCSYAGSRACPNRYSACPLPWTQAT